MSDDDLRQAEEHRDALDAYRGHPWYTDEREPDDDEDESEGGGGSSTTPRPPDRER